MSKYPLHKTNLYNWECISVESQYDKTRVYRFWTEPGLSGTHTIYYNRDKKYIIIDSKVKFYCDSFDMANKYIHNFFRVNKSKIPDYLIGNYFKIKKIYDRFK